MNRRRSIPTLLLTLLLAAFAAAPAAHAAPRLDGTFAVPGLDGNSKLVQGPDGNIWATLPASGSDVARIDPNTGQVTEYSLDSPVIRVEGASGIAVGPEGRLWITFTGGVASFDPSRPEEAVERTFIGQGLGNFHSIAVGGPDGNLWLAAEDAVYRVIPTSPEATITERPFPNLSPRDIDAAGSRMAIADASEVTGKGRIVTFIPAGSEANQDRRNFEISAGSQGVAGGPGGQIAFGVQVQPPTALGLINFPAAPVVTPAPGTDPFGVTFGPDGAYWFVQFLTNSVSRLTPDGQLSPGVQLPQGSQPKQIASGPNNTLWVTLIPEDAAQTRIARIVDVIAPPAPPQPPMPPTRVVDPLPRTALKPGPKIFRTTGAKARVSFRFDSPNADAKFECRQVELSAKRKRGSKRLGFTACSSPKVYKLAPGRYRFEVRAVTGVFVDATPEQRTFKVVRAAKKRP